MLKVICCRIGWLLAIGGQQGKDPHLSRPWLMSRPDVRDSLGLWRSVRDRPLRDCVFVAGGVKRSGESVDVRNVARGGDKGLMGRVYIDKDGGAGQPEPDLGHFVRASTAVRSPCEWERVIGWGNVMRCLRYLTPLYPMDIIFLFLTGFFCSCSFIVIFFLIIKHWNYQTFLCYKLQTTNEVNV